MTKLRSDIEGDSHLPVPSRPLKDGFITCRIHHSPRPRRDRVGENVPLALRDLRLRSLAALSTELAEPSSAAASPSELLALSASALFFKRDIGSSPEQHRPS